MFHSSIFTIVTSRGRADRFVDTLQKMKPPVGEVSVLFLDQSCSNDGDQRFVGSTAERVSANQIRGVFASLRDIRPHHLEGLDPLIASGSLGSALERSLQGELAGRLIDSGLPPLEARFYTSEISKGSFLICVQPLDSDAEQRARIVLSELGAQRICAVKGSSLPEPSR